MAVLFVTHDRALLEHHPEARVLELDDGAIVRDTAADSAA
jgi:ABC-type ATPase involved in cell division